MDGNRILYINILLLQAVIRESETVSPGFSRTVQHIFSSTLYENAVICSLIEKTLHLFLLPSSYQAGIPWHLRDLMKKEAYAKSRFC